MAAAWKAEGWKDIVEMEMVPYGNANVVDGKVVCQHGPQECEGNRWEQCAVEHYPDQDDHVPFIICMETAGDNMLKHVKNCATTAKMEYATLETCFSGPESAELQKKFGKLTPADHQFVPWVIINGKVSQTGGSDLLAEVCKEYTGAKPAGCPNHSMFSFAIVAPKKYETAEPFCHVEEAPILIASE